MESTASAIINGDGLLVDTLSTCLLKPSPNNFVERPWGGVRLRELKGLHPLPDQHRITGQGLGETFEIAAFDGDREARAHPSRIRFEDGSELPLPWLLEHHGSTLLGPSFTARYGGCFPILPKLLNVKELLSVQGHPEGHTEAYVIVDAEPGATIRLGFNRDLDPAAWAAELNEGRMLQRRLLELLEGRIDAQTLQCILQPWFAGRVTGNDLVIDPLETLHSEGLGSLRPLLGQLKALYWRVLDSMNTVPVAAGDVIYNANPERIATSLNRAASAEVHALGNPEGREIVALEIRSPGPTYRAWDNVRFPLRDLDIEAAVAALNMKRTRTEEFRVDKVPVPGRDGVWRSVTAPQFAVEHLMPTHGCPVFVPGEPPHCLHAIRGDVELSTRHGAPLGSLHRGEAAIVPVGVGAYTVSAVVGEAELIKVALPDIGAA